MKRSSSSSLAAPHPLTHAERVIDAASGVTKGEIAAYYAAAAEAILPHLRERPVAFVRAPDGIDGAQIFQKHAGAGAGAGADAMAGVEPLGPELDPGQGPLLEIRSEVGLQSAAQMNVVELHTWNSTVRSITKPDRIVFDLDPGEGVGWPAVREGAVALHACLRELGLKCFVKTSGGNGLHVVVPLMPSRSWAFVKSFAKAVVLRLVGASPQRFVAKSGPRHRVGRIFIDDLRNGWGSTNVSAWSVRARAGLGISVPIGWNELAAVASGAHWTVRNVGARLAVGNRPWEAYSASRQGLATAIRAFGFVPERGLAAAELDLAAKEAA